jgi:hypothetical protein
MPFDTNPCRRNAFDAFPVPKKETHIKKIREIMNLARRDWEERDHNILLPDGAQWPITEAELNRLGDLMTDPLERLKIEQFVHQEHHLSGDEEVRELMGLVAKKHAEEARETIADAADRLWEIFFNRLAAFISAPEPVPLADDMPWPLAPPELKVDVVPFEKIIDEE